MRPSCQPMQSLSTDRVRCCLRMQQQPRIWPPAKCSSAAPSCLQIGRGCRGEKAASTSTKSPGPITPEGCRRRKLKILNQRHLSARAFTCRVRPHTAGKPQTSEPQTSVSVGIAMENLLFQIHHHFTSLNFVWRTFGCLCASHSAKAIVNFLDIMSPPPRSDLPKEFNWRDAADVNLLTMDRSEKSGNFGCGGACWAFAVTSMLSDRLLIKRKGRFPEVRESHVVFRNASPKVIQRMAVPSSSFHAFFASDKPLSYTFGRKRSLYISA